jgi:hypothetical protein
LGNATASEVSASCLKPISEWAIPVPAFAGASAH